MNKRLFTYVWFNVGDSGLKFYEWVYVQTIYTTFP